MRGAAFTAPRASHSYCLQLLRTFDNENFVANTLLPRRGLRRAHAAVRAFNVELARIRTTVSNEDLGRMRISFFRDALTSALSTAPTNIRSPVIEALAEAHATAPGLDLAVLHTLVSARERDLSYPSFATLADLASFAADTQTPLIHAHASGLLPPAAAPAAAADLAVAARFAGEAVGLAVLLRGAPAAAASRLSYAPADLAAASRAQPVALLGPGPAAAAVFGGVARRAARALRLAEDAAAELPASVRPAFWGLELPRIYLPRLEKAGQDPFDEELQRGMRQTYPLRLQLSLLRRRLMGQ